MNYFIRPIMINSKFKGRPCEQGLRIWDGRVREHLCGVYEFLETKKMESLQELEQK